MLKYNAQHKIRFALELKKGSLQKTISKKERKKRMEEEEGSWEDEPVSESKND